jgi:hypothetical protein
MGSWVATLAVKEVLGDQLACSMWQACILGREGWCKDTVAHFVLSISYPSWPLVVSVENHPVEALRGLTLVQV